MCVRVLARLIDTNCNTAVLGKPLVVYTSTIARERERRGNEVKETVQMDKYELYRR